MKFRLQKIFFAAFILATFLLLKNLIPVSASPNKILNENAKPGTQGWQHNPLETQTTINSPIMGYASETSVNHGQSIDFHISTISPTYNISVYRMGYYNGVGARLITTAANLPGSRPPTPSPNPDTGKVDANWPVSYTLQTATDWVSGLYFAKLISSDGAVNYIQFVVRDDETSADILYQSPITTEQAYNNWGNKSLYDFNSPGGRGYKVSFNRPYDRNSGSGDLFTTQLGFVRFLESKGYSISYATSIDVQRDPNLMSNKKVFFSNYHDEYWSKTMRDNLTAWRNAGKNIAFFDANNIYYQIRFEESNRTIVAYKNANLDPLSVTNPSLTTVRWRDTPVNKPENEILGVMFEAMVPYESPVPLVVSNPTHWIFQGTGMQNGDSIPGVVGYEYDKVWSNGLTPAGLEILATSPLHNHEDNDSAANMTIYQHPSGAYVFGAGTMFWVYKIDNNDYAWRGVDARLQRITTNVLDRMIGLSVTPTPTPTATPSSSYPRELPSTNSQIKLYETKAPEGNKVFIQAMVDGTVTAYQVDWYINGAWKAQDKATPWFLGGDTNGAPKGYTLPSSTQQIRAVVYYQGWNYIDTFTTYSFNTGGTPTPVVVTPSPTPTPTPTITPTITPAAGYPKELPSSNNSIKFFETKAPEGNKIFIRADVTGVTVTQFDWYINGGWNSHEAGPPYFLGGDSSGAPNGFNLPTNPTTIRAVVYYQGWDFIEGTTTYSY